MHLNVLLVADQIRGIDGTGGLGDVMAGLGKALAQRNDLDVRLLMPGYEQSLSPLERRFETLVAEFPIRLGNRSFPVQVYRVKLPKASPNDPNLTCYLLRQPETFHRRENSSAQAIMLSRGALEFISTSSEFHPEVIHCHDWHSALIPAYLSTIYANDPVASRCATLYTMHNNSGGAYQGVKPFAEVQPLCGLPSECFIPGRTRSVEHFGHFNFAKGGIGFADLLNTVSRQYARELQTRAFGGSLESVLLDRAMDLFGIINGIDLAEWDPATDPVLPEHLRYSPQMPWEKIVANRTAIRSILSSWKDPEGNTPFAKLRKESVLLAIVSRITDQKIPVCFPLSEDHWPHIPSPIESVLLRENQAQFLILGDVSAGDNRGGRYARTIRQFAERYPDQILFYEGFDIGLSHLINAVADFFLVPSVFEPCGLTQLSAMRYGAIPIVRAVGGLAETVLDETVGELANGFSFIEQESSVETWQNPIELGPAAVELERSIRRALGVHRQKSRLSELMGRAMHRDSSWKLPAANYRQLYDEAVHRHLNRMIESNRVPLQRKTSPHLIFLERITTLPPAAILNLRKLAAGYFGAFERSQPFLQELRSLESLGYIQGEIGRLPDRGENLSDHISITASGREFVRWHGAWQQSLLLNGLPHPP